MAKEWMNFCRRDDTSYYSSFVFMCKEGAGGVVQESICTGKWSV